MINTRLIIIFVVIVILILLILIALLHFLRSGRKTSRRNKHVKKKKAKTTSSHKRSAAGGPAAKKASPGRAASKTGQGVKSRAVPDAAKRSGKTSGPVPVRLPDDGIEKYARMTEDYTLSKFDVRLKRNELKKYYSERHGFYCVDFTYTVPEDVSFAVFKGNLNDMDTALSNVSGVDTITFASDGVKPVFRTTFYLNK